MQPIIIRLMILYLWFRTNLVLYVMPSSAARLGRQIKMHNLFQQTSTYIYPGGEQPTLQEAICLGLVSSGFSTTPD
jgi:hypothetical protein